MMGDRLTVSLDYGLERGTDAFEWQLYTPEAIGALADRCGFACLIMCARFDDQVSASANDPRMQVVLERIGDPPEDPAR